jgi:hypothetical protein
MRKSESNEDELHFSIPSLLFPELRFCLAEEKGKEKRAERQEPEWEFF